METVMLKFRLALDDDGGDDDDDNDDDWSLHSV